MRLSRTPAGIPAGVQNINPFPLPRACDLDCLTGVNDAYCQFQVCLFAEVYFLGQ